MPEIILPPVLSQIFFTQSNAAEKASDMAVPTFTRGSFICFSNQPLNPFHIPFTASKAVWKASDIPLPTFFTMSFTGFQTVSMNQPETVLKTDLILSQAPVILLQMDVATPTTADFTGPHTVLINQPDTVLKTP